MAAEADDDDDTNVIHEQVTCVDLVDLVDTSLLHAAPLPVTAYAMRNGAAAAAETRLVKLRAPFQVVVAFDKPQSRADVAAFANSLWASYAWYGNHQPCSLWSRVEAWLAHPDTAAIGQRYRTEYFPEWQEMRPPTKDGGLDPDFPRPGFRPSSFICEAHPLVAVDAPDKTWAEKRARERRERVNENKRRKEENARRETENEQRKTDGRRPMLALLPYLPETAAAAAMPTHLIAPGTSLVVSFKFESYHAALFVVTRLMGNTGAGCIKPLGGKVDTRLVWPAPPASSLLALQFYPHKGTAALYLLPQLPDANAEATWRLRVVPASLTGARTLVSAVPPACRDAVLAGGMPHQLDAFVAEMWRLNKDTTTALCTMLAQTRLYTLPARALERLDAPCYHLVHVVYRALGVLRRVRPGLRIKTVDTPTPKRPALDAPPHPAPPAKRAKKGEAAGDGPVIDTIARRVFLKKTERVVDDQGNDVMEVIERGPEELERLAGRPQPVQGMRPKLREIAIDTGEAKRPLQTGLKRYYAAGRQEFPPEPPPPPPPPRVRPPPAPLKTKTRTGLLRYFTT